MTSNNVVKALATIATGPMSQLLDSSLQTLRPFAARHGYDLVVGHGECEDRPPAWGKVLLIRDLLSLYETVLWVDADAVIVDIAKDPADEVPHGYFQAMVRHSFGDELIPNTGVWLMRQSELSRSFLDEVWARKEFTTDQWWENAAVIDLLGYSIRPTRPVALSQFTAGTFWLGSEWNSHIGIDGLVDCRIRHYAGWNNERRRARMRLDVAAANDRRAIALGHTLAWKVRSLRARLRMLASKLG